MVLSCWLGLNHVTLHSMNKGSDRAALVGNPPQLTRGFKELKEPGHTTTVNLSAWTIKDDNVKFMQCEYSVSSKVIVRNRTVRTFVSKIALLKRETPPATECDKDDKDDCRVIRTIAQSSRLSSCEKTPCRVMRHGVSLTRSLQGQVVELKEQLKVEKDQVKHLQTALKEQLLADTTREEIPPRSEIGYPFNDLQAAKEKVGK
ncbi:hypothetical protein GRJ2_003152100 [Grus japonensis]|uniref:Uncharacterized protein n=1 Tax=Grus japonensis TaxID=30415 RepID=A0ABC9YC64_GRUJA